MSDRPGSPPPPAPAAASTTARIVVTQPGIPPRAFDGLSVVIGRAADIDVTIEAGLVSRRHCELSLRADGLWLRDLDSSHGTWLDGRRLTTARRIDPGTRIRLGKSGPELIASVVGAAFPPAPPPADRPRTAAYVFGVFLGTAAALAALALHPSAMTWIAAARTAAGR